MTAHTCQVAVATPAHSSIRDGLLSYRSSTELPPGTVVLVPLGKRRVIGIVWSDSAGANESTGTGSSPVRLRDVLWTAPCVLDAQWRRLLEFSARYYHHSLGEMAVQALPPIWRKAPDAERLHARFQRFEKRLQKQLQKQPPDKPDNSSDSTLPTLHPQQTAAMELLLKSDRPSLLWGVTGSGKTEVYMRCIARVLARDDTAQALVLVPEINLTPQLESVFRQRFAASVGTHGIVSIHSALTPLQRETSWLLAQRGTARIVLGTRTAVFTPMPQLRIIIVDEEHDPSYKSQDGARCHARDLAIYRAAQATPALPVILGSATPSMESWHACEQQKYQRVDMPLRADSAQTTDIRLIDCNALPAQRLLAPASLDALQNCLQQGTQALIFLNRRGYAPVLFCPECRWKSDCHACSAHMVLHRSRSQPSPADSDSDSNSHDHSHDHSSAAPARTGWLRCHHCGHKAPAPNHCPACDHPTLLELGAGTQMLEERLHEQLADLPTAHGQPARILRVDADSSKGRDTLTQQLHSVHTAEVDILLGTQMITKGHDFAGIQLVIAIDCDHSLYAADFRAPERLFSQLVQAAGRAGRRKARADAPAPAMLIQTRLPEHPLYQQLIRGDFQGFAASALHQRAQAALPPFLHQAILRAESRSMDAALHFLRSLSSQSRDLQAQWNTCVYPPVPMGMRKIAHMERAQMLIEADSRRELHGFLHAWKQQWQQRPQSRRPAPSGSISRWHLEIDPLHI